MDYQRKDESISGFCHFIRIFSGTGRPKLRPQQERLEDGEERRKHLENEPHPQA